MSDGGRSPVSVHDMDKGVVKELKPRTDRLQLAAFFLKGLLLLCAAGLLLVVFDSVFRSGVNEGRGTALFRSLDLSGPALIPSGRMARNPDFIDRRVDSRFFPFFPLPDPDPAKMIIGGAEGTPMEERNGGTAGGRDG